MFDGDRHMLKTVGWQQEVIKRLYPQYNYYYCRELRK